jgi:hypothetical protein
MGIKGADRIKKNKLEELYFSCGSKEIFISSEGSQTLLTNKYCNKIFYSLHVIYFKKLAGSQTKIKDPIASLK